VGRQGMLRHLSEAMDRQLAAWLQPDITDLTREALAARPCIALDPAAASSLGIEVVGGAPTILVSDPARPVGRIRILSGGEGNVLALDNRGWSGTCVASIRILGSRSLVMLEDIAGGYVQLTEVLLRSHRQLLYWGAGSSAVGISVELEGEERCCVVGDDALVSNGAWIRNYDMHAIHDLGSGAQINRTPCDSVLERHVWLGQDALLLSCERVGMGSIIGARSVVKGFVPPRAVAAGMPARVLRDNTSWGRSSLGMTDLERTRIGVVSRGITKD
jgi:hypothetical protein